KVELTWNERKFVNDVLAQNVKDVLAQNVNDVMLDRACRPYRNDLYNGYRCSKPAFLASFGR
ncbi:hypothetical protein ACTNE5_11375, partial [Acidaminococcus fermentans]|uniref:hypothetical protein n=1 Tax=Acidaminococcus fermentans TaxID=905 RepID=UPI003F88CD36